MLWANLLGYNPRGTWGFARHLRASGNPTPDGSRQDTSRPDTPARLDMDVAFPFK
jgi:hypothetical protein